MRGGEGTGNRLSEALAERLRNLQGNEQVVNFGGVDEEIRVLVDRGELAAPGLTIDDVPTRLAAADVKNPAGTQRGDQQQLRIRVAGELDATSRVAAVPMVSGNLLAGAAIVVLVGSSPWAGARRRR